MKKYNFNAGPSMLPREVIENTAKQILDFNVFIWLSNDVFVALFTLFLHNF